MQIESGITVRQSSIANTIGSVSGVLYRVRRRKPTAAGCHGDVVWFPYRRSCDPQRLNSPEEQFPVLPTQVLPRQRRNHVSFVLLQDIVAVLSTIRIFPCLGVVSFGHPEAGTRNTIAYNSKDSLASYVVPLASTSAQVI